MNLHHGDCIEVMAGMEPESVDAIVTDCAHEWFEDMDVGSIEPLYRCAKCRALVTQTDTVTVTDLAAGTAAEHLVCADLLMSGYRAFLSDQNCPYDVAVELDGRLVRVQVKATRRPRKIPQRVEHHSAYLFHTRRAGKGGVRRYADDAFDVLALVALDVRQIAYVPFSGLRDTIFIRVPGTVYGGKNGIGRQFDDLTFERAVE